MAEYIVGGAYLVIVSIAIVTALFFIHRQDVKDQGRG